jgi:dynein assembly factor 1
MENCEQVKMLPSLTSLDLRDNLIDKKDALIPFFQEMPNLLALYVKGNPCIRLVNQFRKTLIQYMPSLAYLDERPISEIERLTADAYVRGGIEEEKRVREEYNNKK